MTRMLGLLLLLFVAVITAVPALRPQGATALSGFLKAAVDRGDFPGVVVAVVDKGGVLHHEAFGKSSSLRNTPMARDTIRGTAETTGRRPRRHLARKREATSASVMTAT